MARTAGRSLELLSLLQTADRWSGPELAARLGVSLRTLRRDVDTLRDLGYPVHASGGRASTYRLGAGSSLPPLVLDGEQAVAISLALQTSPTTVLGLRDASDRALHTLARVMPPPLRAQVDATRLTIVRNYWEFSAPPIAPEALHAVGDAVRRGHLLRLTLRADGSRPGPWDADFAPPRRVEPHHLVLWAGRWSLVARDPGSGEWGVHRVDRLRPHDPTGMPFRRRELPGGDVAAFVVTSHARGDNPRSLVVGRDRGHPRHLRHRPQRRGAARAAGGLPRDGAAVRRSLTYRLRPEHSAPDRLRDGLPQLGRRGRTPEVGGRVLP